MPGVLIRSGQNRAKHGVEVGRLKRPDRRMPGIKAQPSGLWAAGGRAITDIDRLPGNTSRSCLTVGQRVQTTVGQSVRLLIIVIVDVHRAPRR